jgi:uncharacterized protein (DUF362 family)/ferredoxin-like protein FixX
MRHSGLLGKPVYFGTMAKAKVAVVRAADYELQLLRPALEKAFSLLGGLEGFIPRGAKVFVKVNLLPPPSPPERAIITHPVFTEAVLSFLKELTPHIVVGDDVHEARSFDVGGYREMCQRLGVELLNLRERGFTEVKLNGGVLKSVYVAKALLEADVVVNLPKLKTHALTTFTGAIKNFYGVIPTGLRTKLHGEHPKPEEFAQVLVDIFSLARPGLTVMDGIVAMEGPGPANGTPRPLGLILAGADAVAVDAVAQAIIGLDPLRVWTTYHAHTRGLGVGDLREIEILGEGLEAVRVKDFRLPPAAGEMVGRVPSSLTRWATRHLQAQPVVVRSRCVACGACVRACPTGAAQFREKKAWIDKRKCIRCMCCHEACRYNAIELKLDILGRFFRAAERWVYRDRRR